MTGASRYLTEEPLDLLALQRQVATLEDGAIASFLGTLLIAPEPLFSRGGMLVVPDGNLLVDQGQQH